MKTLSQQNLGRLRLVAAIYRNEKEARISARKKSNPDITAERILDHAIHLVDEEPEGATLLTRAIRSRRGRRTSRNRFEDLRNIQFPKDVSDSELDVTGKWLVQAASDEIVRNPVLHVNGGFEPDETPNMSLDLVGEIDVLQQPGEKVRENQGKRVTNAIAKLSDKEATSIAAWAVKKRVHSFDEALEMFPRVSETELQDELASENDAKRRQKSSRARNTLEKLLLLSLAVFLSLGISYADRNTQRGDAASRQDILQEHTLASRQCAVDPINSEILLIASRQCATESKPPKKMMA